MKRKEKVELTVSVNEIVQLVEKEYGSKLPASPMVVPLHGKEPQVGHAGEFSGIRISWETESP